MINWEGTQLRVAQVAADNPVNSRSYSESKERENCPQIIFGYFTAKMWKKLQCLDDTNDLKTKNTDSPEGY